MELKGTIVFDVSPALLGAINRISDVFSANRVLNDSDSKVTDVGAVKSLASEEIKGKADSTQPVQALDSEKISVVKYTKEQLKAAAAAKKEKRGEMKKILDEMGAKSISALSENQYEEFMQKISVL